MCFFISSNLEVHISFKSSEYVFVYPNEYLLVWLFWCMFELRFLCFLVFILFWKFQLLLRIWNVYLSIRVHISLGQNTFKGDWKGLDVINCHSKLEIYLFPYETMIIITSYLFIIQMNVKKLKLKIHLIQFWVLV